MSVSTIGVVPASASPATVEVVGADDPALVLVHASVTRAAVFAAADLSLVGEIVVALVSDDEIASLNERHRRVASPTDVLTFPAPESVGGGDIAIATGYLARQAERRGVTPHEEAALLALHGVLHLAGHDDLEDEDRLVMQRETKRLADALGIPCEDEWTSLPESISSETAGENTL